MSGNLVSLLNNSLNNYDDTSPTWRAFIDDHKAYLIANSKTYTISMSYMQAYIYDIKRYLRSINYPTNVAWIIQLINNLVNDIPFIDTIGTLLIPPFELIQNLYTNYISAQSSGT